MDVEEMRWYCLEKKGVTEEFPFDETTLVFKVMGKMFVLCPLDEVDPRVNLKCDPERALHLRENHPDIIEGWHMSKKHWNTVYIERELPDDLIRELVDHSYDLVVSKFPKKLRMEYEAL